MAISERTVEELRLLADRYPNPRSALLPMLHLVQSEESAVTPEGVRACAEVLGLTPAEVTAVASFYTMYKNEIMGRHHVGVCTNTLCAVLGGDAVWEALVEAVGDGTPLGNHGRTVSTEDFFLERIECQAACTHAPVMTVDWEFIDDVTPKAAVDIVGRLKAGEQVNATRGPAIRGIAATERTLAFPDDGLADANCVDDKMLAGLRAHKDAPSGEDQ